MEHRSFPVPDGLDGTRVDAGLAKLLGFSRTLAAEIAAGTATLTLTTVGNGTCNAVNDQVTITIIPAPVASAGPDQTRCANNADIPLAGGVTNATGGTWTGGLGIYSPNANNLNATYTPTAAEILARVP